MISLPSVPLVVGDSLLGSVLPESSEILSGGGEELFHDFALRRRYSTRIEELVGDLRRRRRRRRREVEEREREERGRWNEPTPKESCYPQPSQTTYRYPQRRFHPRCT